MVFGAGVLIGTRFLYFFLTGYGEGKIQSVILSAVMLLMGFLLYFLGVLADLISMNRKPLEETNWRLWRLHERIDALAAQGVSKN